MNYFTKEFYDATQRCGFDSALEKDEKTGTSDEAYYHALFSLKEAEYLALNSLPQDSEEGKAQFAALLEAYVRQLKEELPSTLQEQIADLRVFAMNRATGKVMRAVQKYCEENRKYCAKVLSAYEKYYKKASADFYLDMISQIGFHDCIVKEIVFQLKDMFLAFDGENNYSYITAMRFIGVQTVDKTGLLPGAVWLYEEVYKVEEKYELKVLVRLPDGTVSEFCVRADKFEFRGAVR